MREPIFNPGWPSDIAYVHEVNQQFVAPRVRPNVYHWYRLRTARISGIIRNKLPMGGRVLDIGCAQGMIAITLGELGFKVVGNDIRSEYIEYAKLRDDRGVVDWRVGNFLEFSTKEVFDAIIFTEVIEHLVDHRAFLAHIYKCLKPGGVLIVTTPNCDYIRQPLPSYREVNMSANKEREFTADGNDHFYLFKKQELVSLLGDAGFEILEHEYFLPFVEYGTFKFHVLWRILPSSLLALFARAFDNTKYLCAQQCAVVRRPLGN